MIPPLIEKGLEMYAKHGYATGGFLRGVLTNNLFEAVGRADSTSLAALKEICEYVHNRLPAKSWGSEERVDAWIEEHQPKEDEGELIASETDEHGGLHTVHVREVEESVLDPRD